MSDAQSCRRQFIASRALVQHIFNEYPIAAGGIVDKHVRDGAYELAILDDRTAAHSLNDARFFKLDVDRCGSTSSFA